VSRRGEASVTVRPADLREGERLREIAIASKSYWGYDLDAVRASASMGDFSSDGLRKKEVYVADVEGRIAGWIALIPRGDVCWLDDLWVEPEWIGASVGSVLFRYAEKRGTELGASRMEWEAEPNAVGFYEKMGARHLRDGELSAWCRVIAVMGCDLTYTE
jgi:GNAT superfamily N-acetyltransferase